MNLDAQYSMALSVPASKQFGGLSGRFQRRYAYRDCPYMKVDVKFEAVESPEDKSNEYATDKITQISTPFLEWQISD